MTHETAESFIFRPAKLPTRLPAVGGTAEPIPVIASRSGREQKTVPDGKCRAGREGLAGRVNAAGLPQGLTEIQIVFFSVYWSIDSRPLSLPPKPDSLNPPNGVKMSPSE